MTLRKAGLNQVIASAKAGFSERTARNIERRGLPQKQYKKVSKRINDPLDKV
ncbi:hypothetical protein [Rickettsia endosymbiont of Gonocerus acuteangulatus]